MCTRDKSRHSQSGVTLIELFAYMTDQLIYRLNRVPERQYVTFLDLLGVRLFPPTAATAPVTFWLAAPQPDTVRIPAATQVATVRTETEQKIEQLVRFVQEAGRIPVQRDTLYNELRRWNR